MPHLTLEYTANLGVRAPNRDLLLRLHHLLESEAGIRVENCKSRWRGLPDWAVGDGQGESAFVHLDIRLLEGRPLETREALGREALEVLKGHFHPPLAGVELQITVEVREIRKALYFKEPPGTLGAPPLRKV